MTACRAVEKLAKGVGRVRKILGKDADKLLNPLFSEILHHGRHGRTFEGGQSAWMDIIASIADDDISEQAVRGLKGLADRVSRGNLGKNVLSLFDPRILRDRKAVSEFLELFESAHGVGPDGMDTLANALLGRTNIQGTWYALAFGKERGRGFTSVVRFEQGVGHTRVRGIDVVLRMDDGSLRYFELKSGRDLTSGDLDQVISHLEGLPNPGAWENFRVVLNTHPPELPPGAVIPDPDDYLQVQALRLLDRFEANPDRRPISDILARMSREIPAGVSRDRAVDWIKDRFLDGFPLPVPMRSS